MRELPMCSTAIGTNEGPEICADILWSQVVAVDAALVGAQHYKTTRLEDCLSLARVQAGGTGL
jgi:hypothetical protein